MFLYNVKTMHYYAIIYHLQDLRSRIAERTGEKISTSYVPVSKIGNKYPERKCSRPEQYHIFYPNTNANTQYFQRGLNNYTQYQFLEEALTILNTNTNIHERSKPGVFFGHPQGGYGRHLPSDGLSF